MNFSIFEVIMLIGFGLSWPFSIYRSYRARTAKGKSLLFLVFIELAYISGILHKLIFSLDIVLALYILNAIMVSIDIAFYFRNSRLDKAHTTDKEIFS